MLALIARGLSFVFVGKGGRILRFGETVLTLGVSVIYRKRNEDNLRKTKRELEEQKQLVRLALQDNEAITKERDQLKKELKATKKELELEVKAREDAQRDVDG